MRTDMQTRRIRIVTEATGAVEAEITWGRNPKTAEAVWRALPIEANAERWGEEVYFPIPVEMGLENPQETVEVGDLGYWPPGNSLCIFFGPTPISRGREIRPASPVNIFGRIIGNPKVFNRVRSGDTIRVEAAE